MTDAEFADALEFNNRRDRNICVMIRALCAEQLDCNSGELTAQIHTEQIFQDSKSAFVGEQILGFLEMKVEEVFAVKISINDTEVFPFFTTSFLGRFKNEGASTFGEWVCNLTRLVSNKITESKGKK